MVRSPWPFLLAVAACLAAPPARPRLVVLTDIGGDPDDTQSLVRLMTFANEFDIEGLVASASGTPGELKRDVVQPRLIRQVIEAYAKVRPHLARQAPGYPPARALLAVIASGSPLRGVAHLGAQGDTEGSRRIIAAAGRNDPRPLNLCVWGGAHDLAQALWRVRHDRGPAATARFVAKLRVYSVGHQDDTGPWIVANFPDLFFILSSADPADVLGAAQGRVDRRLSSYRGMYLGGDESLTSREWLDEHVRAGHGPLGALYPGKAWTAPNPHGAMKEGDTPSWFYFLPNGLSDPAHPEWGGWGGRFRLVRGRFYNDAGDRVGQVRDARATVWRWREAFQNAFAARMDWCRPGPANHPPAAVLNGDRSLAVLRLQAASGAPVRLTAAGSADPDGGRLRFHWFHYPEPGGWEHAADLGGADRQSLQFTAPQVREPREMHIVLEVRDGGTPPLTAYRRAAIRLTPPADKQ